MHDLLLTVTNQTLSILAPFIAWTTTLDIDRTLILALSIALIAVTITAGYIYSDLIDYRTENHWMRKDIKRLATLIESYTNSEFASHRAYTDLAERMDKQIKQSNEHIKRRDDRVRQLQQDIIEANRRYSLFLRHLQANYTISQRGKRGRFSGKADPVSVYKSFIVSTSGTESVSENNNQKG